MQKLRVQIYKNTQFLRINHWQIPANASVAFSYFNYYYVNYKLYFAFPPKTKMEDCNTAVMLVFHL